MATVNDLPQATLSVTDAMVIIIGVVVGAGIFRTPSLVAANSSSTSEALLFWLFGGVVSLIGALCYAELATAYPHSGGEYHFMTRAFGPLPGFLFAWARITVIQTGSIAMLAFIIGDYLSELIPLGTFSSSFYAALTVVLLTFVNIAGIRQGKWVQQILMTALVLGLLLVVTVGLSLGAVPAGPAVATTTQVCRFSHIGQGMIFVLLTYGGWNEAAYLSAEVRDGRRNMVKVLLGSIAAITAIYLVVNFVLLQGLGLGGVAQSKAVAADLMRLRLGENGARIISLLIAVAVLSTMNATIITGARTSYALGRDFPLLGVLGHWRVGSGTPTNALFAQGAIALLLVVLGTGSRGGFETMVEYTSPVFWFFVLLVGCSLFVLRRRYPAAPRPFQVPLYPLTPLLFCAACGYMLYSSLTYVGRGTFFGLAVLMAGLPLLWLASPPSISRCGQWRNKG
ncbi:MAG: amino acid permease [Desulfuromonadaceae bacterium]|nr:amino acid permease [Desulfuromonadaceae bacterium]